MLWYGAEAVKVGMQTSFESFVRCEEQPWPAHLTLLSHPTPSWRQNHKKPIPIKGSSLKSSQLPASLPVASVHAFRDHAQNPGIYSVLCPKHWYLQRFRLFLQPTAQGCGTRKPVTSVYLALKHPKHAVPKE